MLEMWRLAAEKKLAICLLVGPDAIPALDRMCSKFPGTTVVIDHMARIGMDGIVRDRDVSALCHLSRHARVYVKVSAFYALGKKRAPYNDLAPLVHHLYGAFGSRRLMWGSDSPFPGSTSTHICRVSRICPRPIAILIAGRQRLDIAEIR